MWILARWLLERVNFQPFQIHVHKMKVKTENFKNHEEKKAKKLIESSHILITHFLYWTL